MLFIGMPVLEIWLLFQVSDMIGTLETVVLVIGTGVVGAGMARTQGAQILRLIQADLAQGQMPAPRVLDGLMILTAGLLLITPGIITDTIGFLLLVPLVRNEIRVWMRRKLERKLRDGSVQIRFGPW